MCINLLPIAAFAEAFAVTVNGGTGSGNYEAGTPVTITANKPETGKRFKEWTGADGLTFTAGDKTSATATFTMPAQGVSVTATYEDIPATYTVTVNSGTGSGSYEAGKPVTITANTAETGKRFKEWTGADGLTFTAGDKTSATATFTMPAQGVSVTATYEDIPAPTTYTVTINDSDHGTVTTDKATAASGETVTLTVTPAENYVLQSLNITDADNTPVSLVSNYSFTMPASNVTVTVTFKEKAPDTYTVTVSNDGHGSGSANPKSGAQGTEVTLTSTPSEGYKFKEWQVVSGGVTVADNKFTIGTANVEVKAVFEEITYVVTVGTATHGKVTVDKTSAPKDAKVTITISPDSGYVLDKLTVKDPASNEIAVTSNAFTMPACNVTVSATFKAAPGPVTYSITSGANGAWIKGSGLTFSYTAKRSTADNECISHFKGVTIDNNILPITDYTIKSGSTIVTIKAYALQRLSAGVHTVTLWFDDGTVSTFLYIWADPRYPATGDERQTATWAALTGVTFVGMAAVVVLGSMYWKKKKSKSE